MFMMEAILDLAIDEEDNDENDGDLEWRKKFVDGMWPNAGHTKKNGEIASLKDIY